jgi:hypothetical protein
MKTLFLQITIVAISFSSCTSIESSNIINKNDNKNIIDTFSPTPKILDNKWQRAIFEGLKIGVSSRSDALKTLGKPNSSTISDYNDKPEGSDREDFELMDKYENFGFYGELTIIYSKKNETIIEIVSYPNNVTVEEAIKHFGENYKRTQYNFMECPGDVGSSRIYESKNGEFKYIEYRSKGIAIKIDDSEKEVENISFVSQPIGMNSADCSKKDQKIQE